MLTYSTAAEVLHRCPYKTRIVSDSNPSVTGVLNVFLLSEGRRFKYHLYENTWS